MDIAPEGTVWEALAPLHTLVATDRSILTTLRKNSKGKTETNHAQEASFVFDVPGSVSL